MNSAPCCSSGSLVIEYGRQLSEFIYPSLAFPDGKSPLRWFLYRRQPKFLSATKYVLESRLSFIKTAQSSWHGDRALYDLRLLVEVENELTPIKPPSLV